VFKHVAPKQRIYNWFLKNALLTGDIKTGKIMAASYYKMQEVMDKLNKTEQEVQDLVKEGKLRQYMDAGKPVFKVEDVDALAEEIVGLDLTSDENELELAVEESGEIALQPDEEDKEKDKKESEGGFGLSQMGDLTSADTNVGTIGLNLLSGTEDAYKLTEDTKAETQAGDIDEIESLDADANLESFGSGSGLLDLSLQADDTSLGAVLDDILPTGAEGGDIAAEPIADEAGLVGEAEELSGQAEAAGMPEMVSAETPMPGAVMPGSPLMVQVMPEDPTSGIYGTMMVFPVALLILAGTLVTAAIQDTAPSLLKMLVETTVANISLIWIIAGAAALIILAMWAMTATKGEKKTKSPQKPREKKQKKKA
jgi:hypothetical protein